MIVEFQRMAFLLVMSHLSLLHSKVLRKTPNPALLITGGHGENGPLSSVETFVLESTSPLTVTGEEGKCFHLIQMRYILVHTVCLENYLDCLNLSLTEIIAEIRFGNLQACGRQIFQFLVVVPNHLSKNDENY